MTLEDSRTARYVAAIEARVDQLARMIVAATDDQWTRRHDAEAWTAAEVCGHVAELISYWAEQARALAAQPGRTFGRPLDDPERTGAVSAGASLSRHDAVERLRAASATAAREIQQIPLTALTTEGVSASRGAMTVEQMLERFIASHLEEHIAQVERAFGS